MTALVASAVMAAVPSCTKKGCMDARATNYDEDAEKEDEDEPCDYTGVDTTTYDELTIVASAEGTGTTTWTANNTYVLDGMVFVNSGDVLTIEAGTVIKGKEGVGEAASALIVARGGKIMAEGTADLPIIFTAEADQTEYKDGKVVQATDLSASDAGLWGGLIILGNAGLNSAPGETAIEGIPTSESRGLYGGSNDADNSGVLKYVSIRYGGSNIGANNEINGLTLGGVGTGTEIDYVEVYGNSDDGVEFFGGTVNTKHLLVSNTGDDSFDYDEGFRGKGQYWVSLNPGDRHGEHDGGTSPEDGTPYATPTIYNATYIGDGKLTFRDNAGGSYSNSVLLVDKIDIEELASGEDSRARLEAGDLWIGENIISSTTTIVDSEDADLTGHANVATQSTTSAGVTAANPVPSSTATASGPSDSFLDDADYMGAFSGSNWAEGWTRTFQ